MLVHRELNNSDDFHGYELRAKKIGWKNVIHRG